MITDIFYVLIFSLFLVAFMVLGLAIVILLLPFSILIGIIGLIGAIIELFIKHD